MATALSATFDELSELENDILRMVCCISLLADQVELSDDTIDQRNLRGYLVESLERHIKDAHGHFYKVWDIAGRSRLQEAQALGG